ncbi:MAG TPA: hypothetical protein VIS52_02915, partial [Motiliproteus sp.]
MKRINWPPVIAGSTILFLLSFLFYQAQSVDSLNREHGSVLEVLHQAQRLDDQLRQDVMLIYYEREHNFDGLLQLQRDL